jgi:DNA-binding PadR family transcriptional regulator
MAQNDADLLQGTLDMLILKTVALYRLERRGWIDYEWSASENGRRAKYYRLTKAGRKQLASETESWERLSAALNQILETA